jgi:hypothetical protein
MDKRERRDTPPHIVKRYGLDGLDGLESQKIEKYRILYNSNPSNTSNQVAFINYGGMSKGAYYEFCN